MEVQQSDESMEDLNEPELTDPSEESVTERIKKSQEEWHWQKQNKTKLRIKGVLGGVSCDWKHKI